MYEFPVELRLRTKHEFDRVFAEGKSFRHRGTVVYLAPNRLEVTRLGMAAGRRLGNAPRRNRIKRLVREAFRLLRPQMPAGFDMVVVPIFQRGDYSLEDFRTALSLAAQQAARRCESSSGSREESSSC